MSDSPKGLRWNPGLPQGSQQEIGPINVKNDFFFIDTVIEALMKKEKKATDLKNDIFWK